MTSSTRLALALTFAGALALSMFACDPDATEGAATGERIASDQEFLKVCAGMKSDGGQNVVPGIDISHAQGTAFNLRAQKANGVEFVYMKASDGITYSDPNYQLYRKEANALGMMHGAYHFFEPNDDGVAQANNFLKAIKAGLDGGVDAGVLDCDLPPALDWEVVNGVAWSTAEANAQAFLNTVQAATGRTPIIYTSSAFFPLPVKGVGGLPTSFANYPLWVAQYPTTCPNINPPWTAWTMFQFSNPANNVLDLDYYNGTLSELQSLAQCAPADAGVDAGVDGGVDAGVDAGSGADAGAPDGGPCVQDGNPSIRGNGEDCCTGPQEWNADTDICGKCIQPGQPSQCGCGSDCCSGHWPASGGPNC